jgi:Mrp family chromosome partitioning ATPase
MADERPLPPDDPVRPAGDEESSPRHRILLEEESLPPPAAQATQPGAVPRLSRGTIRMVRPNLSALAPGDLEPAAPSVIDVPAPTTDRMPAAQQAYGPPPQPAPPPNALARTVPLGHGPPSAMVPARIVVGQPPRVSPRTVDPRLVLLTEPDSARAAGYRRLRDNLLAKGLPRVLAVSSATPREGKTTCAINVALALAEHTPARVLLLDGNFFEPSLGAIFHVNESTPTTPDIAAWLAPYRLAELTPSLHVAAFVLPRGEPVPRFEKHRFDMLLDRLCRIGYEHVIVDAPAIEGSPMVTQLLGGVDGVLLTVRSGRTTARALRRAVEELPGGKGLGVALVDAEPT